MSTNSLIHTGIFLLILLSDLFGQSYTSYHTGNKEDRVTKPIGGIVMMGGSRESDEAMKWFLERSKGGDVLVLRASGSDGYNDYLFSELGITVNSVESIVIHERNAIGEKYIWQKIEQAEAIWFAGGNQLNYVNYFRDSPLRRRLVDAVKNRNVVIGGTSAGMAILGGRYFSARRGTIQSDQALLNPFNPRITIESKDFLELPLLDRVVTDTHYSQRKREARHLVFMARAQDGPFDFVNGIACDESTAIAIDGTGKACVFTKEGRQGNAYFIQINCTVRRGYPESMKEDQPFTWWKNNRALVVYKVTGDTSGKKWFSLKDWKSGKGGVWEYWSVNEGKLRVIDGEAPNCTPLILREY